MSSAQSIELFRRSTNDRDASTAQGTPCARVWLAFLRANARYWTTVFPHVRSEIGRWQTASRSIRDPRLRELAEGKLRDERFNLELAATLATIAPLARRRVAVEAIVAMQVLYDYLDALGERQLLDRAAEAAFTDALRISIVPSDGRRLDEPPSPNAPSRDDDTYLQALTAVAKGAFASLPRAQAVESAAQAAAERCTTAQRLSHATRHRGDRELCTWASDAIARSSQEMLGWREWLAGAQASVLCEHALVAAACDPRTTTRDASLLDDLYLSIGALTMLDSIIDLSQDAAAGEAGYTRFYETHSRMARRLALVAKAAAHRAGALPDGPWHVMMLTGVVAYYCSAPAPGPAWQEVTEEVCTALRPAIGPTLALMRGWRAVKRLQARAHRN